MSINCLLSRVAAAILACCAGLTVGCGDSPYSPTPMSAPPAAPAPAPAVMIVTSMSPSAGPAIGGDYIWISGDQFQTGATVTVGGIAATITKVTTSQIIAQTPPHALGVVDVVVMNPNGESDGVKGGYTYAPFTVAASSSVVMAGGALTVSFEAPRGRGCQGGGDWIAIYRVGDPDETGAANGHSDLWYEHLCGAATGTFTLSAPDQAGTYEFRYMVGGTSVARSNPVRIEAS